MKKCPHCGELNPDSATNCDVCSAIMQSTAQQTTTLTPRKTTTPTPRRELTMEDRVKNLEYLLTEANGSLDVMKKCMIFFVALAVISLIVSLIFSISTGMKINSFINDFSGLFRR